MIRLTVNGQPREVLADPETPLLYVLRNDLGLTGTKFGCGLGQCGACTVLVGGQAVRSCMLPVQAVAGQAVTTIEGLGSTASPPPSGDFHRRAGGTVRVLHARNRDDRQSLSGSDAAPDGSPGQAGTGRRAVPVRDTRTGDPGGHARGLDDGRALRWQIIG